MAPVDFSATPRRSASHFRVRAATLCARLAPALLGLVAILAAGNLAAAGSFEPVLVNGQPAHPTRILARRTAGAAASASLAGPQALAAFDLGEVREYAIVPGLLLLDDTAPASGAARALSARSRADALLDRISLLQASGLYEYVEPDYVVRAAAIPADSAFANGTLWGLRNTGRDGGVAGVDINAATAWDITTGSDQVIIAVIDSGIRVTHQDLAPRMWRNPGEIAGNGIDDDGNGHVDDVFGLDALDGIGDPLDSQGHGTGVAGIIGAAANQGGPMVGVAWQGRLMACRFLDDDGLGTTSDAIESIDYAVESGATILNCSWGGPAYSESLYASMRAAGDRGVLIIVAAGNEASQADFSPAYPAAFDLPNILSVCAFDRRGTLAAFSNFGSASVDIGAPGVAVYSTAALTNSSYASSDGTSAAAPFVSGVAALVRARYPGDSLLDVRDRLLNTAVPLAGLAGLCGTGGRVDAGRAVGLATTGVLKVALSPADGSAVSTARPFVVRARVTDVVRFAGASVQGSVEGTGAVVALRDDGQAPDEAAGDGVYAGAFVTGSEAPEVRVEVTASAPGRLSGTASVSYTVFAPPPNDDFERRAPLAGVDAIATPVQTAGATLEAGEPEHSAEASAGASAWWTWRAPADTTVRIATAASDYDTVLAVYTGETLSSLVLVARNNDAGFDDATSFVELDAVQGVAYHIAVAAVGGKGGDTHLRLGTEVRPQNDDFANRIRLTGDSVDAIGGNINATRELGEPGLGGAMAGRSIWWSWTAPSAGVVTIVLDDADHLTALAAFTGSALDGLAPVASIAEDIWGWNSRRMVFVVEEGVEYQIGADDAGGLGREFSFHIRLASGVPNDAFADRIALSGESESVITDNTSATREAGEPVPSPYTAGGSLWWSWTAPAAGKATVRIEEGNAMVAVYSGSTLSSLAPLPFAQSGIAALARTFEFRAEAGTAYVIFVDTVFSSRGRIRFSIGLVGAPVNDTFANRTVVSGVSVAMPATLKDATIEPGESWGMDEAASVWWSWTAPAPGYTQIAARGAITVSTGDTLASLSPVADTRGGTRARGLFSFEPVAGVTYQIRVAGESSAVPFTFLLTQAPPPANDSFGSRTVLVGARATDAGSNVGASVDTGESATTGSVWWTWTAPTAGVATFSTEGSTFDTVLTLFRGTALAQLQTLAANDNADAEVTFSRVRLVVAPGDVVQIRVAGAPDQFGAIVLGVDLSPLPANDGFSGRVVLSGESTSASGDDFGASVESGEPTSSGELRRSLWWEWTAPHRGTAIIEIGGDDSVHRLDVFTGGALNTLVAVTNTENLRPSRKTVVHVEAGTTLYIRIGSAGSLSGAASLSIELMPAPANDMFADRAVVSGDQLRLLAPMQYATRETGEEVVNMLPASLWWSWTAPESGRLVLSIARTGDSASVHAGDSVSGLSRLATAQYVTGKRATIAVSSGTTYAISYNSLAGSGYTGELSLLFTDPPVNDDFAARTILSGDDATASGSTIGAVEEAGEAGLAEAEYASNSVWWRWVAPESRAYVVSTAGSDFDTVLAIYEGSAIESLRVKASNNDGASADGSSLAILEAAAGTEYQIRIAGFQSRMGAVQLSIEPLALPADVRVVPSSQPALAGRWLSLYVEAQSLAPLSYQWYRNGELLPGKTDALLDLPYVQAFDVGAYTVHVGNAAGVVATPSIAFDFDEAVTREARPLNLATRALCLTGDSVLIPGFVISGTGTKRLLIRGVGPRLRDLGVDGELPNPQIALKRWNRALNGTGGYEDVLENDDWGSNANSAEISATSAVVGAFPLLAGSLDSAVLTDLPPGQYTVIANGVADATGVALVELYDADVGAPTATLVNMSNRGFVGTGGQIMIPGFVVSPQGARTFLIRAVGPSLATLGIEGVLADPRLAIFTRNEVIFEVDDWDGIPGSTRTAAVSRTVGAFPLEPGSRDAAFVVTLPPGPYTVHASGAGGTTGIALVEVYLVP